MQRTINYIPRESPPPPPSDHTSPESVRSQYRIADLASPTSSTTHIITSPTTDYRPNARALNSRIPTPTAAVLTSLQQPAAAYYQDDREAQLQRPAARPGARVVDRQPLQRILTNINNVTSRARGQSHKLVQQVQPSTHRPHATILSNEQTSSDEEANELADSTKTRGTLRKRRKSNPNSLSLRRTQSANDTSKYIEHLESQLAIAQNQLVSLTSPTAIRSQGAKMRMMHAEATVLKQQLADWENKFSSRVKEQVAEHQYIAESLRSQLDEYQQEREQDKQRLRELELACQEKDQSLVAVENAKEDLERRLDFLTELLATSPSKVDLHSPEMRAHDHQNNRQKESHRRLSTMLMSPNRRWSRKFAAHGSSDAGSELPAAPSRPMSVAFSDARYSAIMPPSDSGYATEQFSEMSMNLVSSEDEISPASRRVSWIRAFPISESSESQGPRNRISRRMRRFHSGSTGPRSLILPSTNNVGSWPVSSPVDTIPASISETVSSSDFLKPPAAHAGLWFPKRLSHSRSPSAFEEEDQTEYFHNRARSIQVSLASNPSSPLPDVQIEECKSNSSHSSSSDTSVRNKESPSRMSRAVSMSSLQDFNLFEDLNRFKESSPPLVSDPCSPTTAGLYYSRTEDCRETETVDTDRRYRPSTTSLDETLLSSEPSDEFEYTLPQSHDLSSTLLLSSATSLVTRSLDDYAAPACTMVSQAWQTATLSRPVVEFRWWLVRVLVRGLKDQQHRIAARRVVAMGGSATVGLGLVGPRGLPLAPVKIARGESQVTSRDERMFRQHVQDEVQDDVRPVEPCQSEIEGPSAWVKFGMTLVVAVGLAIKDGPASLLVQRADDDSDDGADLL